MRGLLASRGEEPILQPYEDAILRRNGEHWMTSGDPEVWAQYRHALVQGLPWWFDVQAGVSLTPQSQGGLGTLKYVTGLYIGGFAGTNSYFDAEVLITSLHGDRDTGSLIVKARRDAVQNNIRDGKYVGVIVGNGAAPELKDIDPNKKSAAKQRARLSEKPLFPCPMPKNQDGWVAGFYRVTDVWHIRTKPQTTAMPALSETLSTSGRTTRSKTSTQNEDAGKIDIDDQEDDDTSEPPVVGPGKSRSTRGAKSVPPASKKDTKSAVSNKVTAQADGRKRKRTDNAEDTTADDGADPKADLDNNADPTDDAEPGSKTGSTTGRKPAAKAVKKTSAYDAPEWKDVVTMFRLERWDIENKAWYAKNDPSHDPPPLDERDYTIQVPTSTCQTCQQLSPKMFEEIFLCQNVACPDHWREAGSISTRELTYTKAFLQKRDGARLNNSGGSAMPILAYDFEVLRTKYEAINTANWTPQNFNDEMKLLSQGFRCPQCNMLNRRTKWNQWNCVNGTCLFSFHAPPPRLTTQKLLELIPQTRPSKQSTGPDFWKKAVTSKAKVTRDLFDYEEDLDDYTAYHYNLEHRCGLTIFVPKDGTNAKPHNADWLYEQVITRAESGQIPLEKNFTEAPLPGILTDHFVVNYGQPYQLSVQIKDTLPWSDAPELDIARQHVHNLTQRWQLRDVLGDLEENEGDFNECYIAGYFTSNHMGWHDDGEEGLGSVVATWTLGGTGRMHVGVKTKHYYGKGKGKGDMRYLKTDYALPGCVDEAERKKLLKVHTDVCAQYWNVVTNPEHRQKQEESKDKWMKAYQALVDKTPIPAKPDPKILLDIPLPHGSIVVMRGELMQQLYEHRIHVETPLRIALTFRHISEKHAVAQKTGGKAPGENPHFPDETHHLKYPLEMWKTRKSKGSPSKNSEVTQPTSSAVTQGSAVTTGSSVTTGPTFTTGNILPTGSTIPTGSATTTNPNAGRGRRAARGTGRGTGTNKRKRSKDQDDDAED